MTTEEIIDLIEKHQRGADTSAYWALEALKGEIRILTQSQATEAKNRQQDVHGDILAQGAFSGQILESHKEGDVTVIDKFKVNSIILTHHPTERVKCHCPCHQDSSVKHVEPCCDSGFVEMPIFTGG